MPELPEVECLTRAVRLVAEQARLQDATFLRKNLRDPIPIKQFKEMMEGLVIERVFRRSKYLLMENAAGLAIIHLGMTGNIFAYDSPTPTLAHTHARCLHN